MTKIMKTSRTPDRVLSTFALEGLYSPLECDNCYINYMFKSENEMHETQYLHN